MGTQQEIVVDNFAGGGGASTGIAIAIGRDPDEAINHDPEALAMHMANHPGTRHWCQSVWKADPRDIAQGRPVGLAWFSPDCKHFSKAKGGKPVKKNIRDLAWVIIHWAQLVRPRIIMLENVEEFRDWGPLIETQDGKMMPCPLRRGFTYRRWKRELTKLGYVVEEREIRAMLYGAPTSRKRLFIIARCDGRPIVWPQPTHGNGIASLAPVRVAADCIDWSIPCPSIFTRKKALQENTLRRIAMGIKRYVLDNPKPFIVPVTHSGDARVHGIDEPMRTLTCAPRGEHALVTPFVTKFNSGSVGSSVEEPLHTITANSFVKRPGGAPTMGVVSPVVVRTAHGEPRGRGDHDPAAPLPTITGSPDFGIAVPYIVPRYGERPGQEPRTHAVNRPAPTIVPTANGAQLVAAFLAQHNTGLVGHHADTEPLSTIVGKGCTQAVVSAGLVNLKGEDRRGSSIEAPTPTQTAGGWHIAEVRAFLVKYFGTAIGADLNEPLDTVTSRDRFACVTVLIEGVEYTIVDIGMRMLTPRELFNAQGFPADYIIAPEYNGKPLTKTAQIRMVGNSVCPPVAEALVRANFQVEERAVNVRRAKRPRAAATGMAALL